MTILAASITVPRHSLALLADLLRPRRADLPPPDCPEAEPQAPRSSLSLFFPHVAVGCWMAGGSGQDRRTADW